VLGLYLHVPFCSRRCDYCDFYVVVGRDEARARFVEAIEREVLAAASRLEGLDRAADTIYVGGGTPSLLAPGEIGRLVAACRGAFDVAKEAEITMEANPEGIDRERLDGWLGAGINRLSVGVQTLDDEGLRRRGRLHSAARALDSIPLARAAGFMNVNADLIAGLPLAGGAGERRSGGAFVSGFADGLRSLLDHRPDHLSVYLFETDKETPLMRAVVEGRERLPEDDDVAEAYAAALAATAAAGYEHYEIANFCLEGRRSRHNLKYWTDQPYLGFGPSAHSYFEGRRTSSPRDLDAWIAAAGAGGPEPADYTLPDRESAAREALILNLRLMEGVDLDRFDAKWGTGSRAWIRKGAADALDAGLIALEGATLKLTERGMLLANEVFSRLTSA
jgi:oxygen-independent coproporphyrinogen-3 oxidase